MSKIAEALAKAKEQTGHTTAPFLRGEAPANSGTISDTKLAILRKAKRARIFWMVLAPCSLALTLFVLWSRWDEIFPAAPAPAPEPAAPGLSAPVKTTPTQAAAPEQAEVVAHTGRVVVDAPVAVVLPPAPDPTASAAGPTDAPAPPPPAIPPRPEIAVAVGNLVFTAVMPGEKPRLMYRGRVVGVGERVEGEIIFAGIVNGSLVFNDSRGAVYTRRY